MKTLKSVAIAVALLGLIAWKLNYDSQKHPRPERQTQDRSAAQSPAQGTLIVTGVTQSSYGATAADITPEFVSNLEEHFVEESRKQYQSAMKSQGFSDAEIDYNVGTTLFNESGERLAVTTLKPKKGKVGSKIAWWIIDGEIRRAVCVDTDGNEIAIRFGPCAAKISEVFGYTHWALDSKR